MLAIRQASYASFSLSLSLSIARMMCSGPGCGRRQIVITRAPCTPRTPASHWASGQQDINSAVDVMCCFLAVGAIFHSCLLPRDLVPVVLGRSSAWLTNFQAAMHPLIFSTLFVLCSLFQPLPVPLLLFRLRRRCCRFNYTQQFVTLFSHHSG